MVYKRSGTQGTYNFNISRLDATESQFFVIAQSLTPTPTWDGKGKCLFFLKSTT